MQPGKWAFRLAVALGCLSLFLCAVNPLIGLLHAAICFVFAFGIRRRRAWAAFAAAGFWLIPIAVLLTRGAPLEVAPALIVSAAFGITMLWTAVAFWRDPATRTAAWPWAAFLLLFTIGIVSFRPFRQPSASMSPTVLPGDYFLVDTASWSLGRSPARNQIVAFHYPLDRRQIYIKRIVGLPGDSVSLRDRQLVLNGSPVHEPWAIHTSTFADPYRDNFPAGNAQFLKPPAETMLRDNLRDGHIIVPPDSYFVLGDDRDDSLDSRYFGFIRRADLVGSPVLIYGSYNLPAEPSNQTSTVLQMRWNRLLKRL